VPKVFTPNKKYTGISAGVSFSNGVGESTDPHLLSWFESHGYTVEAEEVSKFDNMSIEELKAYAEENEIDIGQSTSQKGILKKILEAESKKETE